MTDPVEAARAHQTTAADPDLSVFVTANAGSGKTTTLVNRVARLLLKRVRPGEILCVTYTKAAAAEMQARLFDKLGRWAVADDRRLQQELASLDGREPSRFSGAELSEARRLFARALETPGGLKIQTIHAFCEKLLRRFPLEAGVLPGFEVLEDQAARDLSHAAREDLARLALEDPEGPVGAAYAHFAVELDFAAFHGLLDAVEARREALLAYLERIEAGTAPAPRMLLGVDARSAAEVEADFLRWLDREEWLEAAGALAGGSTSDQDCAARMRQAADSWSFAALEPEVATALAAAVLEACRWLDEDPQHRVQAAHWLAEGMIDLPPGRLAECLLAGGSGLRFHGDGAVNFPWLSDGRWFLHQFRRWGWLSPDAAEDDALLAEVHRIDGYRLAALQAGVPLPRGDSRTSILFDGMRWE